MSGRDASTPRTFMVMASTPFHGHRLYEQRLAAALGAHHPVIYVEPPAHPFRPDRNHAPLPPGVSLVRPWTVPYGRRRALAWISGVVAAAWTWAVLLARRAPEVTVIATSMHPVTRRLLGRLDTIALVKDDYVAGADLLGADASRLARRRASALRRADTVVVVSPVLQETVAQLLDIDARVIPAGCDLPAEDPGPEPPELAGVPRPRAVFIGLVSDRIDFGYFTAVAAAGLHVVVVGGVQATFSGHEELARLDAADRLTRVPATTADRVEAILRHCDLGLVPYTLSDFNQASFPLKTLEYLAAGLPVLGSALTSLRWLEAPHVVTGPADEVPALLAELDATDDGKVAARCRAFAARNSWAERAVEYERLADGLAARRSD